MATPQTIGLSLRFIHVLHQHCFITLSSLCDSFCGHVLLLRIGIVPSVLSIFLITLLRFGLSHSSDFFLFFLKPKGPPCTFHILLQCQPYSSLLCDTSTCLYIYMYICASTPYSSPLLVYLFVVIGRSGPSTRNRSAKLIA